MVGSAAAAAVNLSGSGTARNRGINYHGNLGRMLRDLTGFATLAFELLQNADDAAATRLCIDVGHDALTVFNDAVFSDCGDQDLVPEDCLFLTERGHRCDFHSFRDVASGDKRDRADTTGAFGIGFTAVYQVADTAVLISNGRRWEIDEMQPEASRIIEHRAAGAPGTTFILPWARNPDSLFRLRTASAAIGQDDPQRLFDVLATTLPTAMLFLRHVREVELLHDGRVTHQYHRDDADNLCEITDGIQRHLWLMLHGDFAEDAAELRGMFPGKIEDRRRAEVSVAIPLKADAVGLLCAYLPTDERSGLPAHINADFYPESDRKHLVTDSFHGQWNRLAVRAAARILAQRLPDLAPLLEHEQLWRLIFAAYEAKPSGPDTGINAYWEELGSILPTSPVMWTTTSQWAIPAATVFLSSSEDDEIIPVLEQLGVLVMHPQVGAFVRRMTGLAGTRPLSIDILAATLQDKGLINPTPLVDAPAAIAARESREILWRELERLLKRGPSHDRTRLRHTAIMPANDGRLWPADQLKHTDTATSELITDLGLELALLDPSALPDECVQLSGLCPSLDLPSVLTLLAEGDGAHQLRDTLNTKRVTANRILSWLRSHEQAILASQDLRARVRALPIYPTGSGYRSLDEVVLPGGFTDRLGIAEVIDREQVADHVGFLQQLGATLLTLRTYLTESVPRAAQRPAMLTDQRWPELIVDLAAHLDDFANHTDVRQALTPLPLVACDDGVFRPASLCYFASDTVTVVLSGNASIARPLSEHERSTTSLYQWLGVATEPRLPDVVARVQSLAAGDQDIHARRSVADVIAYLGRMVPDRRTAPNTLNPLRDLAWLQTRNDQAWHRAAELHTTFRETLFATQGRFLNIPRKVQQDAADFLHWLGVATNPSVGLVVAHLLTQIGNRAPVSPDVYVELNRNSQDPAIGRLVGTPCLLLPDGSYIPPAAAFRTDNPFGRFRQLLGPDFDAIGDLLDRLGVKRIPDHEDARAVLIDIAREQGERFHLPIEDENDLAVIWHCWQMLDDALGRGENTAGWLTPLRHQSVVPNAIAVPTPPTRLLIDDMPGVATALDIGDAIIRRKEGMWRAIQAAGVRSLTDAVEIEIVQIQETTRGGAVRTLLYARRSALARILDGKPDGLSRLTTTLANLTFPQTPVLRIRYHLPDFGLTSDETSSNALYVPADPDGDRPAQLISCPHDDSTWPWMLIAKEFARALYPGETPGPLASSLYVVLNAPSLDAAHSALNDAGWPQLDHVDVIVASPGPPASFDDPNATEQHPDQATTAPAEPAAHRPDGATTPPAANSDADATENQPTRRDEPTRIGPAPVLDRTPTQSTRPWDPDSTDRPLPNTQRPSGEHSSARARRGRLRSYVLIDPADGINPTPADLSSVDQAGVSRVVEFERAAGRHPEVMPHHNPGFDIASRDDSGRIVRHIEVKSTSGAWDDMGVGLTRTQFTFAQQHRQTFWLYVVEHALDDDHAQVHRIADPPNRAEEYRFDGGWSAASEDTASDPPPPTNAQRAPRAPNGSWVPLRTLRDDLTAATQPDEWIEWPGINTSPDSYAVQVLGHALEPDISCGTLVLVEPIARQPEDGELIVVQLHSGFDPDGFASATIRYWRMHNEDDTHPAPFVILAGSATNHISPLQVARSTVDVCGKVIAIRSN